MLAANSSGSSGIIQFITVLLIFVIVLGVTYFVTRWLGNYQKMQNTGRNVEVIESVRISPSAYVEILRVGKKYIAVAVSKDSVSMLTEISPEDIAEGSSESVSALDFGSILDKVRNKTVKISEDSSGKQE